MKGLLVRVGIDSTCGNWNCPLDPDTNDFVYVPIPEGAANIRPGCKHSYAEVLPALKRFGVTLPANLQQLFMHLDPDFATLTYGDCHPRSLPIQQMRQGDFIAFYAGLQPIRRNGRLVYALIGFYRIAEVVRAKDVPRERWDENAHTRRSDSPDDVIVRAEPGKSGRLAKCIPIGEYRDRAYRVRADVLAAWGGLSVNDGYLQRSGRLPSFTAPERFLTWFMEQRVPLFAGNNP